MTGKNCMVGLKWPMHNHTWLKLNIYCLNFALKKKSIAPFKYRQFENFLQESEEQNHRFKVVRKKLVLNINLFFQLP